MTFDRDTHVEATAPGHYHVRIDPSWWIVRGPNGGYLAAILMRALVAAVDDPTREARSITVHYLRAPAQGAAEVETRIERSGRSVTHATARLVQGGALQLLATAVFSNRTGELEFQDAEMPEVPAPDDVPLDTAAYTIPIRAHFERRWVFGSSSGAEQSIAQVGGWIRLAEPRVYDAALLAQISDAWSPAVFTRRGLGPGRGAPTLDLTVHFRAPAVARTVDPTEPVLALFTSRLARDGFVEEDGEIWSRDGVLLAQSRQLALMG